MALLFAPCAVLTLELLCHLRSEKRKKRERNKTDKRENETGERQGVSGVSPYPYTGGPLSIQGPQQGFASSPPPASCDPTRSLPPKSIGLSRERRVFRSVFRNIDGIKVRYEHVRSGDGDRQQPSKLLTRRFGQAENPQIERSVGATTRRI